VEGGGVLAREAARLDDLSPAQRAMARKLGIQVGALDVFVPAALRSAPLAAWATLARVWGLAPVTPPSGLAPCSPERRCHWAIAVPAARSCAWTWPKSCSTRPMACAKAIGAAASCSIRRWPARWA
jgi:hypothetical protein